MLFFAAEESAQDVNFKIQSLPFSFVEGVDGVSLDLGFIFLHA